MTQILRQSTEVVVHIGPFVDVTDGFTPETGVTLSGADEAELLKAGATTTTSISAATWAAITGADGWYALTLTAPLTDTVGTLTIAVNDDSVFLPVLARFQVIEEAAYDAIYAASASPATTGGAVGSVTGAVGSVTGAVGSVTGAVGSVTGNVGGNVVGSVASVTGNVGGNVVGTVASVVGAVGSVTGAVGSVTGNVGGIAGTITTLDALDTAQDSQHSTTQAAVAALNDLSTADVAGEISGEFTLQIGQGRLPTASTVADSVWDEATSGHVTAGTFGVASTDTLADTAELQADWTNGGRLDLLLDSVITAIAALPDAAAVNAQMVDALATDTYAEPGSVPAATASLAAKIGFIAALARNKITQTATTQTLRNDADGANIATRTVSDDATTYTQSEWT